jgi:hypothetical protein
MRGALALVALAIAYLILKDIVGGQATLFGLIIILLCMVPLLFLAKRGPEGDAKADQTKRNRSLQDDVGGRVQFDVSSDHAPEPYAADEEVKQAVASTSSSSTRILYLRPFTIDGVLQVRNPKQDGLAAYCVPFYRMIIPLHISLDDAMRKCLHGCGDLVAIGAPGDAIGAARIRVPDAKWKDYFRLLAKESPAIIMFPGLRPGTLWEIEAIWKDPELLKKTLFAFPPANIRQRTRSDVHETDEIIELFKERGLPLPNDLKAGEAIVFDRQRAVAQRVQLFKLDLYGVVVSKSALRRAIRSIQLLPSSTAAEANGPIIGIDKPLPAFLNRTGGSAVTETQHSQKDDARKAG